MEVNENDFERQKSPEWKKYIIHLILFLATLGSTTFIGMQFSGKGSSFSSGLTYSIAFLGFLTFHEFGHYFVAIYHRVKTSLPYYIPIPMYPIGTMGAVIRIKETITTKKKYFDIGKHKNLQMIVDYMILPLF